MTKKVEHSTNFTNGQLYIPDLGDKIVLTEDWTFPIYSESRNDNFIESVMETPYMSRELVTEEVNKIMKYTSDVERFEYIFRELIGVYFEKNVKVYNRKKFKYYSYEADISGEYLDMIRPNITIPSGTVLYVDRIYIRKGSEDFSSITFRVEKFPDKKNHRFWVKLHDSRSIVGNIYSRIR